MATTFEEMNCAFPADLAEALKLMADEQTRGRPLAGGTDLMVQWESGVLPMPERAISVKHLPELRNIEETDDALIIGSAVTHMALRRSDLVVRHLPSLADAAATIGGYQIQTMGTIGGSVANASPAGDLAPSIMITDGEVIVASVRGERAIPVNEFWTGYRKTDMAEDEIIVRFRLPKMPAGGREYWRKLGPRKAQAISKVMGSCRLLVSDGKIEQFRVAIGSVAPVCVRLRAVEELVTGKPLNEETIAAAEACATESVKPIDDIRSTADYRKWVTGRMVRGFLEQLQS